MEANQIDSETLQAWIDSGKKLTVLDVRPDEQRSEWQIPGSVHINAYDKLNANDSQALAGLNIDKGAPVVTVCAGGRVSLTAAKMLQEQGFETYSLKGGMKGWSLAWNTATKHFPKFEIVQFRRTGKGCLSYMIVSDGEAMVVDASLPTNAYADILSEKELKLKYVLDTHIHADHLSRSKMLAEELGAELYLPIPNKAEFAYAPIDDVTILQVGNVSIKAIRTPGHTMESTCYLIDNKVLLTGDTLFISGVGRPDLKADETEAKKRGRALYKSLQTLLQMDEDIIVLPGHISEPAAFDHIMIEATLKTVKQDAALVNLSEDEFVSTILQRIPPTPPNYQVIAEKNLKGDFSDINPVDFEAGANRCAIS